MSEVIKGYIEGFKRFDSVIVIKAFGAKSSGTKTHELAYIVYTIDDDKTPRWAYIREPEFELYTTVTEDCTGTEIHEPNSHIKTGVFAEAAMLQFFTALKEKLPVNLVIAVVKTETRRYEFVSSAEFM